jgi:hypothetical protein
VSTIRLPLRQRRERILIGLALIATAAAIFPAASAAGRHHLVFRLTGPSHQNIVATEAVVISVGCPTEACTVVASAGAKSPSVHTGTVRSHLAGGSTEQLTLPLAPAQGAKLAAARNAGKSPTLTVHAAARDSAGNRVHLTLLVRSDHS